MDPQLRKPFCGILGAVLTYSLGSFYFGYAMAYFSAQDFTQLYQIFDIGLEPSLAEGFFSGLLPFGALLGAYLSSKMISHLSRRQSLMFVDVMVICSTVLTLFEATPMLVIGRFFQGCSVGLSSSLVPLVVKQYSPRQWMGSFGALQSPTIGLGFVIAYLLPYVLAKHYQVSSTWRLCFAVPIFSSLLQLGLILFKYRNETLKYLVVQGRVQQARVLSQEMYSESCSESVLRQIIAENVSNSIDANPSGIETVGHKQDQTPELQNNLQNQQNESPYPLNAVKMQHKYPDDIATAVVFAFLLQTFHQFSGINVIVIYGKKLASGVLPQWEAEMPLIINTWKLLAGLTGTVLLKNYGRKHLILRGNALILLSLAGLAVGYAVQNPTPSLQTLTLACFLTFISAFVTTLGPITWLHIPQIVQPPIVPYTTMLNWALACLIITVFPLLQDYKSQVFIFFACMTVLNLLMCWRVMVETRGRNELEVRREWQGTDARVRRWLGLEGGH